MSDDGIQYEVIDKAEIPPQQQCAKGNFGQWLAIGRLLKLLEPTQAVRVDVGDMANASVLSALYSAARGAGIKVSLQRNGGSVYVVRRGVQPVDRKPIIEKFKCRYCRQEFKKNHRMQEVCRSAECQSKRKRANNIARNVRVQVAKRGGNG